MIFGSSIWHRLLQKQLMQFGTSHCWKSTMMTFLWASAVTPTFSPSLTSTGTLMNGSTWTKSTAMFTLCQSRFQMWRIPNKLKVKNILVMSISLWTLTILADSGSWPRIPCNSVTMILLIPHTLLISWKVQKDIGSIELTLPMGKSLLLAVPFTDWLPRIVLSKTLSLPKSSN